MDLTGEQGSVTAEGSCLLVIVTALALVLYHFIISLRFSDLLYRPFELALGWIFGGW